MLFILYQLGNQIISRTIQNVHLLNLHTSSNDLAALHHCTSNAIKTKLIKSNQLLAIRYFQWVLMPVVSL